MENQKEEIEWISKAKGFAILGIVAVHAVARFNIGGIISNTAAQGMYCVQLFFVISAYLTFRSLDKNCSEKWTSKKYIHYILHKASRLLPVCAVMVLWQFIIYACSIGEIPDIKNSIYRKAFLAITFLNGFSYDFINPWGNWYLGILIQFLALSPLLHRLIDTPKKSAYFFILTTLTGYFSTMILNKFGIDTSWYFYFWLPRQLPVLSIGIMLHVFQKQYSSEEKQNALKLLIFAISFFFLLSLFTRTPMETHVQYGLLLTSFSYILFNNKYKIFGWLKLLGENSYGIYLYHLCFLFMYDSIAETKPRSERIFDFLAFYAILLVLSLLLSKLTNLILEKPFFKFINHFLTSPCKKSS